MWTDIWCFTCMHEIRQKFGGAWLHVDEDDELNCVCIKDDLGCQP